MITNHGYSPIPNRQDRAWKKLYSQSPSTKTLSANISSNKNLHTEKREVTILAAKFQFGDWKGQYYLSTCLGCSLQLLNKRNYPSVAVKDILSV